MSELNKEIEQLKVPWKKALAFILKRYKLIGDKETGRIIINLNEGGITYVEKTIKVKD